MNTNPRTKLPLFFAGIYLALSVTARAVDPPPDGGYSGENTAEGHDALFSLANGVENVAIGFNALYENIRGSGNTATGANALRRNTIGDGNTAEGVRALFNNTTGADNTGVGRFALMQNTTGDNNTAVGAYALDDNIIGSGNTATGANALAANLNGSNNSASGLDALQSNTNGDNNTANGVDALGSNTSGYQNTATGSGALSANTTGFFNTAEGSPALSANTTGFQNTATGSQALINNTTGYNNTAIGYGTLTFATIGTSNTALGSEALELNTTGSGNIAVGAGAGSNITAGSGNIDIGNAGVANENNVIRIGAGGHRNTFIAGINGVTVAGGVGVIIDSSGHLGTMTSSARYKELIKPMARASESILALQPVTFRYKEDLDPTGTAQFGLVAEEVEKVNPDLVARDAQGKTYTVRYEAVNAMLLNEFLKEHRRVVELETTVARLQTGENQHLVAMEQQQKQIDLLEKALAEQAAQIEKVDAALRLSTSSSDVVATRVSSN